MVFEPGSNAFMPVYEILACNAHITYAPSSLQIMSKSPRLWHISPYVPTKSLKIQIFFQLFP
ncbi:hypothetical protein BBPC_0187 [Bifidobacterium pseudocatenulatum DSM 20438 = JCM 1200 = LMG 10505]|nr:hypothetical protein BBPC_0187 [Bifidobacterium pseudocatenulatum DSM 20438 = JCM 1200 = LMG 10505]